MLVMKDVSDEFKLSFRSTAEISEAFGLMVSRVAGNKAIRYRGKKPPRGAVLNALVMWATSLSKDEQQAVIARGMELLNEHLDADDAAPEAAAEPEAPPAPKRRKA